MLDGSEHESSGEYLEVVKPERLSMSWRWTGGVEDPGESLVEIRLRAVAEGTELTFTHSRLHDEESRRSHQEGWNGALDKLERHFLATEPQRACRELRATDSGIPTRTETSKSPRNFKSKSGTKNQ